VRLIQAENKRTQLCLQRELAEDTITSLTKVTAVSATHVRHGKKKKIVKEKKNRY